jgi:hypothetical protein
MAQEISIPNAQSTAKIRNSLAVALLGPGSPSWPSRSPL